MIGKMEVKELLTYLRERLKRGVEIVPPKQDGAAAGDEKIKGSGGGGGGEEEKKEKEVEGGGGGGEETMMKKMEHHKSYNVETHYAMMPMGMHDEYGMYHQSYMRMGHVAGPPLPPPTYVNMNDTVFSDDNPNGCHVM